ncbi:phosphoglycerate mutase-like protein [Xylariaceae sp. FL1272]|nr:phosphoglycerate mutase-like protein [Xylariaceae sp. FL1272]
MPPTLILIRHGQATHNVADSDGIKPYHLHDPALTEVGVADCAQGLRDTIKEDPLAQRAQLIITSPMIRTCETTLAALDWLIEAGIKVEADADWQENSEKPCDTGSDISTVQAKISHMKHYSRLDFSNVDPAWTEKTAEDSPYHFTRKAILERGQRALEKLYSRKEDVIIVVSHSGFMRRGVTGAQYYNADYRIFTFADREDADPEAPYRLVQDERTLNSTNETKHLILEEQKSGGRGISPAAPVLFGFGLLDPEEEPAI